MRKRAVVLFMSGTLVCRDIHMAIQRPHTRTNLPYCSALRLYTYWRSGLFFMLPESRNPDSPILGLSTAAGLFLGNSLGIPGKRATMMILIIEFPAAAGNGQLQRFKAVAICIQEHLPIMPGSDCTHTVFTDRAARWHARCRTTATGLLQPSEELPGRATPSCCLPPPLLACARRRGACGSRCVPQHRLRPTRRTPDVHASKAQPPGGSQVAAQQVVSCKLRPPVPGWQNQSRAGCAHR